MEPYLKGLELTDSIFQPIGREPDTNMNIVKNDIGASNTSNTDTIGLSMNNNPKITTQTNLTGWDSGLDNIGVDTTNTKTTDTTNPKTTVDKGMFSSENIGGTLKGAGAIVGALSSIYGTIEQSKFNKEMLGIEKDRVNKNNANQDKLQSNYEGSLG